MDGNKNFKNVTAQAFGQIPFGTAVESPTQQATSWKCGTCQKPYLQCRTCLVPLEDAAASHQDVQYNYRNWMLAQILPDRRYHIVTDQNRSILITEEFISADIDVVSRVLFDDSLNVSSEMSTFLAAWTWIYRNERARIGFAPGLMRFIRFHLMPSEKFWQCKRDVATIPECSEILNVTEWCMNTVNYTKLEEMYFGKMTARKGSPGRFVDLFCTPDQEAKLPKNAMAHEGADPTAIPFQPLNRTNMEQQIPYLQSTNKKLDIPITPFPFQPPQSPRPFNAFQSSGNNFLNVGSVPMGGGNFNPFWPPNIPRAPPGLTNTNVNNYVDPRSLPQINSDILKLLPELQLLKDKYPYLSIQTLMSLWLDSPNRLNDRTPPIAPIPPQETNKWIISKPSHDYDYWKKNVPSGPPMLQGRATKTGKFPAHITPVEFEQMLRKEALACLELQERGQKVAENLGTIVNLVKSEKTKERLIEKQIAKELVRKHTGVKVESLSDLIKREPGAGPSNSKSDLERKNLDRRDKGNRQRVAKVTTSNGDPDKGITKTTSRFYRDQGLPSPTAAVVAERRRRGIDTAIVAKMPSSTSRDKFVSLSPKTQDDTDAIKGHQATYQVDQRRTSDSPYQCFGDRRTPQGPTGRTPQVIVRPRIAYSNNMAERQRTPMATTAATTNFPPPRPPRPDGQGAVFNRPPAPGEARRAGPPLPPPRTMMRGEAAPGRPVPPREGFLPRQPIIKNPQINNTDGNRGAATPNKKI